MDIKVTLTLNNPAYMGMCILDLSKVLMYRLQFDYWKELKTIYSLIVIAWCMKRKENMFKKILVKTKKCLILVII